MRYRESGMPDEQMWSSFFDPQQTLEQLGIDKNVKTLLDIGCGYGTFLIPASSLVGGKVIGIDIDDEMIEVCRKKAHEHDIKNIHLFNGDISTEDTITDIQKHKDEIDYVCLFNILHCEQPMDLLKNAYDILAANGKIGVIHWNYEDTPRGPSLEIRLTPETIIGLALDTGFILEKFVELPPYHFGLVFTKKV